MKELEFDVVFHLAGGQIIPNYMAVKLCSANKHILVKTKQTSKACSHLKKCLPETDISYIEVEATDYFDVKEKIKGCVEKRGYKGSRIGFNVTGGTKVMFAAMRDYCRETGGSSFYIDTQERKVIELNNEYRIFDMPPVFKSVHEFFILANFYDIPEGNGVDILSTCRKNILEIFWKNRKIMNKDIMWRFVDIFEAGKKDQYEKMVDYLFKKMPQVRPYWNALFANAKWSDASRFAGGIWFEQWLLYKLSTCGFQDIRQGIPFGHLQEVDISYTDGYTLTIIECKSGKYTQDAVQRLANLQKQLGGVFGNALMCACKYPEKILEERVKKSDYALVCEEALECLDEMLLRANKVRKQRIYAEKSDYKNN